MVNLAMKSERDKKAFLRKIEQAYNKGFKELTYAEACKEAGFIELKNKNIVVAEELKKQLGILIDGMVSGEVSQISFDIRLKNKADLAIKIPGDTHLYDLRLGDESTKNKNS